MSEAQPKTDVEKPTPTNVGGQAVIEGVMMRAPGSLSVVCRRADGSLVLRERTIPASNPALTKIPVLRGAYTFFSALKIGHQALQWSGRVMEADLLAAEELEKKQGKTHTPEPSAASKVKDAAKDAVKSATNASKLAMLALTQAAMSAGDDAGEPPSKPAAKQAEPEPAAEEFVVVEEAPRSPLLAILPVLFAIGLYVLAPQAAATGIARGLGFDAENYPITHPILQVLTGVAKLTIIVVLFLALRQVRDFRRMFEYHGAEHMAISTYEKEKPLLLENARDVSALHARCGTTFIIMVAMVSVVVFSAIGTVLPPLAVPGWVQWILFFLIKLPFLPLVAGITLEIQKFLAKHCTTGPLQVLLWPGFLVQKITTAKPDDGQLEVALASLRSALANATTVLPAEHPDKSFETYDKLVSSPAYTLKPGEAGA